MLWLRQEARGIRPSQRTALQVRATLGHCRLLGLRAATMRLSTLWHQGGIGPLGRRQESDDYGIGLVLRQLGEVTELEGDGVTFSGQLADSVRCSRDGSHLGQSAHDTRWNQVDWRRRAVAE